MRNERGLSLIATLWIITILSVLAAQFLYSVRLERGIQANLEERIRMDYTARAGLEYFIALLRNDETPYDALDEDWAQGIEGELQDAMRPNHTLSFQVKVTDELARININTADEGQITQLLLRAGADEATAQSLTQAVIQARNEKPFRTVGDLARVEGMTDDLLYGTGTTGSSTSTETIAQGTDEEESQPVPLVEMITVFSVDKNTDAQGNPRVNIATADANALTRIQDEQGNTLFTQGEAEAIIAHREQQPLENIGDLLQTPAVSQQMLDNVRDQLTVGGDNQNEEDNQNRVNINTANQQQLQQVFGDPGIAEDILRYRQRNGQFGSVDDLRKVPVMTQDEMITFADKLTTVEDATIPGLININTAPAEILALLPGMDETKAQAIVDQRQASQKQEGGQAEESSAFQSVGQLLQVEGIDEDTFRQIVGRVTYRSQVFRVESAGVAEDNKVVSRCVAIVDRSGQTAQIRYWYRH